MTSTSSSRDQLLQQTRIHFPRFEQAQVEITPIEKGGSDRRFYRVRSSPEHTLILVKYNLERDENRHYVRIAEFLAEHEIRGPKIYFHDEREGLIWIEDLGETDLWSFRNESWEVRRPLYESALEEIGKLHSLPIEQAAGIRSNLPAEFDAPLYLWEQHYFFDNCLGRYFTVDRELMVEVSRLPVLSEIAQRLADLPRVLVHRDFQSQNIVMRNGCAHLIDFQGMRPGLSKYDIASLFYDPYVTLTEEERLELFEIYREIRADLGTPLRVDDEEILRLCAMQRLMQALGAYAYLGLVRGNKPFLDHIPAALGSLQLVVGQIDGTAPLQRLLAQL
ncbi:MAG: phosphotransferase [Chthoniobacterales bacterium]|nr:phosphotransferase [Chthoniobacterales bacterium]